MTHICGLLKMALMICMHVFRFPIMTTSLSTQVASMLECCHSNEGLLETTPPNLSVLVAINIK